MTKVESLSDTLDIINKIDQLYDTAWNHLIVLVTVLTLFIGVIIPLLIQWAQRRFFKLEAQSIKNELHSHVDSNIKSKLVKEIEEKFETLDQRLNIKIDESLNRLEGMIFMVLAVSEIASADDYLNAFLHYVGASVSLVKAQDEVNIQRSLDAVDMCLSNILSNDLVVEEESATKFTDLIKELKENNKKGKYTNYLAKLRKSFKKVKKEQD